MIHDSAIQFLQPHYDNQCAYFSVQRFKMLLNKLKVVLIGCLAVDEPFQRYANGNSRLYLLRQSDIDNVLLVVNHAFELFD